MSAHKKSYMNLSFVAILQGLFHWASFLVTKVYSQGGSLSHISATHPCAHTSKSAPKWRNAHHQILHP